ncbi:MAG TPA: hypothetical protein H9835_04350 [Candidatus Agathobaculum merdigallinarum]|nr:hypothetical protein [Candidatus Agathobaculum merdigallinarum]
MESLLKKYRIGHSRLRGGSLYGMEVDGNSVRTIEGEGYHALFLCALDAGREDCEWGRFVLRAELPRDMVLVIHALASDENRILRDGQEMLTDDFLREETDARRKKRLFELSDSIRQAGAQDILLYGQRGRYLWLCIELIGAGSACLHDMQVYTPGDNFLQTFPEVYRRNGEFLHRYLSVFSSLYNDLQEEIDSLPALFDLDTAPAALLPEFARWIGLEMDGGFLNEDQCRRLIRSGFRLLSRKGTRAAIEEAIHLLVEEPVYILERVGAEGCREQGREEPFAFTVLIARQSDEQLHTKLLYLINQFRPIRTRVSIVFLGDCIGMDYHCYLDINASLVQSAGGSLNGGAALNGLTCLQ